MVKSNGLPVLEPLSKATEELIEPLVLRDSDYLEIWMDHDDRSFNARAIRALPIQLLPVFSLDRGVTRQGFDWRLDPDPEFGDTIDNDGTWLKVLNGNASYRASAFFRRVPQHRHLGKNDWRRMNEYWLAGTDFTVILIHQCWPRDRIIFRSEEARLNYDFLLRRFFAQNTRAKMQAEFKLNETLPAPIKGWQDREDRPLSGYQRVAMQMGFKQEGLALFMDRGTGKTPIVVNRVCNEAYRKRMDPDDGKMMRVLVIGPNQVRLNWQKEFERFNTQPGKTCVIRGGQVDRFKLLAQAVKEDDECAFGTVIYGYEGAVIDIDFLTRIPWDLIVLDESHFIKSTHTRRWQNLRDLRENSDRRMILTGTPIANSLMDVYAQLEFLAEGLSGFTTFKSFREFHGKFEDQRTSGGSQVQRLVGLKNIPLIQERLARLSFSVTKKEAQLNLPDKVFSVHECAMSPKQAELYQTMLENLAIEVKQEMAKGGNKGMMAEHILTKLLRLTQITSGFLKWDDAVDPQTGTVITKGTIEQIDRVNRKVQATIDIIEDPENDPNEKFIVWCHFVEDIRQVTKALTEKGIRCGAYYGATHERDREKLEHDFNHDPDMKVLVANAQTAGEGLNLVGWNWDEDDESKHLPTYTGAAIFFSVSWSMIGRSQAEDRAHRRGTKMPVRIIDLTVPGTIDEEIRNRVVGKVQTANAIQDISDILKNVLDLDLNEFAQWTE